MEKKHQEKKNRLEQTWIYLYSFLTHVHFAEELFQIQSCFILSPPHVSVMHYIIHEPYYILISETVWIPYVSGPSLQIWCEEHDPMIFRIWNFFISMIQKVWEKIYL